MADEPEIRWAEYPQRSCREPVTDDGLIDHFCDLPDLHPGPHCPKTLKTAIGRRLAWEKVNPGWEQTVTHDDPFADVAEQLKRS